MHDRIELLIVPSASPDAVARVLGRQSVQTSSLVALLIPLEHASGTIVRLLDEAGRPAAVDLAPFARSLSTGGQPVGLARIDGADAQRGWETWQDGERTRVLTVADELWIPLDAEGHPDLDGDMRSFPDGPPASGWRRLRSCLDLGMERILSCRFTPVTRAMERLRSGEGEARAFALVSHGHPLHPPQELPWQQMFRSL